LNGKMHKPEKECETLNIKKKKNNENFNKKLIIFF